MNFNCASFTKSIVFGLALASVGCKKGLPEIASLNSTLSGFAVETSKVTTTSTSTPAFDIQGTCTSKFTDVQVSADAGKNWQSVSKVSSTVSLACSSTGKFSASLKFSEGVFNSSKWSSAGVYSDFLVRGSSSLGYSSSIGVEVTSYAASTPTPAPTTSDTTPPVSACPAASYIGSSSYTFAPSCSDSGGSGCNLTECKLDSGSYVTCSSTTFSSMTEGMHILSIRSTDLAGNIETPIACAFTVDTTAPIMSISNPTPSSGNSSTAFLFNVNYTEANPNAVTLVSGNVTLNTTGSLTGCSVAVSGSGNSTRTVSVSGCLGTGTVGISVASGTSSDLSGYLAPGASSSTASIGNIFTVTYLYNNGQNWNDYVINIGGSHYTASDVACTGSESGGYSSCIHGGEKRKVSVPGYSSCTNLTITETLGAFDWECVVLSGQATFVTRGLKQGKGLRDLINFSTPGWLSNSVTIAYNAASIGSSTSTAWWSNSFANITSGLSLSNAGQIYVLNNSLSSSGHNINADRVAVVTNSTAVLTKGSSSNNCNSSNGETTPTPDQTCLMSAGSQKFLWIEGNFDGYHVSSMAKFNILLKSISFSRLNLIKASYSDLSGIYLLASPNNLLTGIRLSYHDATGITANGALVLNGSNDNVVSDATLSMNNIGENLSASGALVLMGGSTGNSLTRIQSTSNYMNGIYIVGSNNNTLSHMTVMNNGSYTGANGLKAYASTGLVVAGSTFANNLGNGMKLTDLSGGVFANLFSRQNQYSGIYDTVTSGNTLYSHSLFVDTCSTNPNSGINSSCVTQNSSSASIDTTTNLTAASFIGPVSSDSSNIRESASSTTASILVTLSDYLNFDNFFRSWGWSGVFLSGSDRGSCGQGGSDPCKVYDFKLSNSDTVLRNRNGSFTAGSACPSSANGDKTLTGGSSGSHYLANALEIIGDSLGNDNGLCESGDACIYTPNIGAYQGTGNIVYGSGTCIFSTSGGTVSGVTMYAYPTN